MLLILDCDGVLVDSEPLSNAALAATLADYGLRMSVEEVTREFKGRSWDSCERRIEEMMGGRVPGSLRFAYEMRRDAAFRSGLRPVDGVLQALAALGDMPMCVASSGDHVKMRLTLDLCGLWPRFAGRIFSAVDVEHGKPAPDLFLHAARELGFPPAQCIVVEDSAPGIEAGLAAGMTVLGFGVDGGHARFDDMADLPALVGGIRPDFAPR